MIPKNSFALPIKPLPRISIQPCSRMNLVCYREVFNDLKLVGRHRQNLDGLSLIQFLQPDSLAVPEFNSVPVRRCVCRELTERHGLFLRNMVPLLNAGSDSREAKLGSIRNADRALFCWH